MIACNPSDNKLNREAAQWFEKGSWREGLTILPDESVNQSEFYAAFQKNPDRWQKAFEFLKTFNPDSLKNGRTDILGDDLYAAVSEYNSKNEADAKFEAHRKYADIQYVVSGEEKIGVERLEYPEVTTPYNEEKDIVFYNIASTNFRNADKSRFFVFFPPDQHKPGIRISDSVPVKKLVLKVKL